MGKKIGVCTICGQERALKARGLCSTCHQKTVSVRVGICERCKQEKPLPCKGKCQTCYDYERHKGRKKKIDIAICITCKQEKEIACRGQCAVCYKRERRAARGKPDGRIDICITCGRERLITSKGRCDSCTAKEWRINHPQEAIAIKAKYRDMHPGRELELAKRRYAQMPMEKKAELHHKDKQRRDRRATEKPDGDQARMRRNYYLHLEERKAYQEKYRQEHRQILTDKERIRQANKRAQGIKPSEGQLQARREREHKYYQLNGLEKLRKYRGEHPEVQARYKHKRRASEMVSEATLTNLEWFKILEDFGNRCAYCRKGGKLTQDHVIPVSRSGGYTKENIVPACRSCNSRKNNKTPEEARMSYAILR